MSENFHKILVVDDEPYISELLSRWLTVEGYSCMTANSGETALEKIKTEPFDLVISDIMMPGMSGIELLTTIRTSHPDLAVIMVTAVDDRKTAIMTLEIGAYGYVIKPFDRNEILINVVNALERRRLALFSKEYEADLEQKISAATREIKLREEEIVLRLMSATSTRHDETGTHIRRIGLFAAELAKALNWSAESIHAIRLAAPMHDIGKIGIPDTILLKPGSLTVDEFEVMKTHTLIGSSILDNSGIPLLETAREIALFHHERWDGTGYPEGLAGTNIPAAARITGLVDFYDALRSDRCYRPAFSEEETISIMTIAADQFEPLMFDKFLELLPVFRKIRSELGE